MRWRFRQRSANDDNTLVTVHASPKKLMTSAHWYTSKPYWSLRTKSIVTLLHCPANVRHSLDKMRRTMDDDLVGTVSSDDALTSSVVVVSALLRGCCCASDATHAERNT